MLNKFSKKKRILLVAANPANTDLLQLAKEFREIEESIERTKKSELFDIKQVGATRIRDLRRTLNSYKPHIVHFSGHVSAAVFYSKMSLVMRKIHLPRHLQV
jgi:SOS-response transcriptional repressor LexA